ncbi:NAD-dependent epimerase/dehydratase family protein [Sanguibacter sp. Leaf3]|uniref:NAD-dependent epimerase/dehydratase family protein n=1 Tax=Sanguibacter sp. Leaf3 TaxID=1736209 RepID=UPI0006F374ED|nr:NAD-dependent epimerase/dehydratase family protein [Sanguibacter sp. Leaf3]KQT99354.1 nucleoside-diphosphate sugar epimerase [Sanguibacter sp. Leaf3]
MTEPATPADQSVLVTGASGFLGRAVVRELLAGGYAVRTLQRTPSRTPGATDVLGSVTDPEVVARAVAGVDAVVHLAAKVSLAGDPADFERVNVGGTRTLLDAAQAAGVQRVVHVSSPSVAHHGDSIVGDDAGPADPALARGDYARTKAAAELLALARDGAALGDGSRPGSAGSVMRVVAVRPHLVWGPGDTQLVARVVERARAGRLPLLGHGAALIDSTYVDNAASAIVAALRAVDDVHGQAYVITNGEPRPVAELLAGICRAAGVEPPRWSVPASVARAAGSAVEAGWKIRPGADEPPMTRFLAEQLSTAHWFDQRRTRRDLRWEPAVSVDEGLRRLAASYS